MEEYILSIDQGTTSSRAILFDKLGRIVSSAQQEFKQIYPKNGWVEHQPDDILQSVLSTCKEVLNNNQLKPKQILSIGISNQRETTLLWRKDTGQPIYNAIVWQDRRTSDFCNELTEQGHAQYINDKTGLLIDPYFSATKIHWILENVDGARALAEQGNLVFGTVDTYLLWHFTQGQSHYTDATNASRTMLYDIKQGCWDKKLLELFNIPSSILPEVLDSSADFGFCAGEIFGTEIPIQGIAGDQQAALFGQTCFQSGMSKSTYGTGCFLMINTGQEILTSRNRLLSTIAYQLDGKAHYALEGSIFVAGAVVQWMRDGIGLITCANDTERLAKEAAINHGVYFVPAFTGLGAPYWDPDARGAIIGLTRATGVNEIVSAGLQSVCYQTRDLQEAMAKDGIEVQTMRVDGGMAVNQWFVQFLSDTLAIEIDKPTIIETSALGAAYLAGLKAGVFESLEHIQSLWQSDVQLQPLMPENQREKLYAGWQSAVRRISS
ncbi:glycerol kinase GlpK [Thalassotalea atypica]|uniref:glycerol kinase GlpK n=1 Tax=Thalassotalea atypica TaxID=2054316 RepID=UPI002572EF7F|nr:glycerol kinase GlpK [Thalassotalea atypica]